MRRAIEVEVAGQHLVIRSDEGPEYVHELAALVTAQVHELTGPRRGNLTRALALVAIQLADQLLREQDLHGRLRSELQAQLDRIDAAFRALQGHLGGAQEQPSGPPEESSAG